MTTEPITATNTIICGDCRDQLARIPDGGVDLIYLDPPFFSGKDYEIIWKDGSEIRSFTDTEFYTLVCECGEIFPEKNKFCASCGASRDKAVEHKSKDIQAYLQWLRPRLERCRDVLKDTGSIYCHLDWHAVHYVKVMMDEIFGYDNLRGEIIWHYQPGTKSKKFYGRKHDTILFYSKGNKWIYNQPRQPSLRPEQYTNIDENGRKYQINGQGNIYYLDDGRACDDVWSWAVEKEFNSIASSSKERLGYPTQKPESLLKRIIKASSNPGDTVLDPFCGCGTAVAVAQKLGRKWIGIDVSPTSCKLMVKRLRDMKGDWVQITEADIIDLPRTCKELYAMNPFEFQNLVISKLDGKQNPKKVGDKGIDGWTYKTDDFGMRHKQVGLDAAVQVKKSNGVGTPTIDNLVGAMAQDTDNTDGKRGIVVAFSFSKNTYQQVKDLKTKSGITIELITVKGLFDCE